jgi:hypothetical protein
VLRRAGHVCASGRSLAHVTAVLREWQLCLA